MKQNGEASRLVGQLVEVVRKLTPNTTLYLQDIQGTQPAYSIYLPPLLMRRGISSTWRIGRMSPSGSSTTRQPSLRTPEV